MSPPFQISRMDVAKPDDMLPTSATCFNVLRIPAYSSEKVLKEKLLYAIYSNAGFELA